MITIKEIAKKANVSIGTVDRVLHKRGRVASETEQKIRKIVEESDYKPNMIARSLSLKRRWSVAVLMPLTNQDGGYWKKPKSGVLRAGKELETYNVVITFFHYNKYEEQSFREQFQLVLAVKPDGILLAPVLSATAKELIREIPSSTAYLFFDANLEDTRNLSFIGQNSFDSGVLAGDLMKMIIHEPGTIAAIQPMVNDNHIRQRIEGFCDSLESAKELTGKVYIPERSGDKESFRRLLNRVFKENSQVKGIFVSNAACHYAAEYLVDQALESVRLIGYDLVASNIDYLEQGVIDFLICQRPENQGFEGIHLLYRFLAFGSETDRQIFMPLDIITRHNLKYYQYR
jgi:LacI family transcriptional regulator